MTSFLKYALVLAALLLFAACDGPAPEPPASTPVPAPVQAKSPTPEPSPPTPVPAPADPPTIEPPAPTPSPARTPASTPLPEQPPATPSPAPVPTETPAQEKVLTILYWQAPSLPGPYLSAGFKDRDAGAITLEPLAKYRPDGSLIPSLAAEIPTPENGGISQDHRSITWKLKEGLKWSDGSEMTAHDVAFTWRYCADENTGCTASTAFTGVASVEAVDDLTVKITFDSPAPYPYTAFVGTGTPIISRAQFADCIGSAAVTCETQNTAPLGTGPYRILSFTANEEAVYQRNPFYRGEAPYFDRVVMKGGGEAIDAARAVLEAGEADYAWNLQVEPQTLAKMEAAGQGQVISAFASLVERVVINQTNPDPALGDNRSEYLDGQNPHPFLTFTPIPQAMSLAIDRGLIAERLYGFAGEPTCNLVAGPPEYVSTANDGCLTQDIEAANQLLDNNNVLDTDGDGVREHNGVPLRITFHTSANSIREETQELLRGWWRQIGIETELELHDASLFFGGDPVADKDESYRRFFADIQMYATGPDIDPQQHLSGQLCGQIQTRDNNWSGGNDSRSCNPEYDRLFAQLSRTTTGPDRAALVKQLNDIRVQNYYEIPLVNRGVVSAHLNTLRGIRINAWDSELWNIAEWRRGDAGFEAGPLGAVAVLPGEDIQIRSMQSLTGVADLGAPNQRGVVLALAHFGPIQGRNVSMGAGLDSGCSKEMGRAAAETVTGDPRVLGVVGTSCSVAATGAAPVLSEAGLVMVAPSNTAPSLTSDLRGSAGPDHHAGYYRTSNNDLYQARAVAQFAYNQLGRRKMAAIHDGGPYTSGLTNAFADAFEALGGSVAVAAISKGDTEMVPTLTKLAAGSPDGLFFPLFPAEGTYIVQQMGRVPGLENVTRIGGAALLVSDFLAVPEAEDIYFPGPESNFGSNTNEATGKSGDEVMAAYRERFGEEPTSAYLAHAYDATTILLQAIEAASVVDGDTLFIDRAKLRETLTGTKDFNGLIGAISCDEFGDCGTGSLQISHHTDATVTDVAGLPVVYHFAP